MPPVLVDPVQPPKVKPVMASIGPDPKIARRVFALLEQHFDEKTRMYKNDMTDEKIAAEAKTNYGTVASLRKEAYGELAEDPVVTQLKQRIADVKKNFHDEHAKVMVRLSELRDSVGNDIAHLETALNQLTATRQAS